MKRYGSLVEIPYEITRGISEEVMIELAGYFSECARDALKQSGVNVAMRFEFFDGWSRRHAFEPRWNDKIGCVVVTDETS